ncbi:benzoate/H(+) symporter BenE family transporter [uncultured Brevundimonas sp.]|uniref:benzoate/H(+) symporter BenE family transporter n=1 Tax=uncultured Brevundimonas sp. TaxID=213418 RepID=UPI00261B27F0|nr:benzoate/H(+) symporter BenE family transporter [uncultured Brevundimonas sp.]
MNASDAKSLPPASFAAATVATVIGFGGTVALVVQAGQALGANTAQIISMLAALALGIGLTGAVLSWRLKMPVVMAWSTPGAALLATSAGYDWPTAVGAFLLAALMMVVTGMIPALGRLAARIPSGVASGMLAGVLLPFCLKLFQAVSVDAAFVIGLIVLFLVAKRFAATWAVPVVLVAAFVVLGLRGQLALSFDTGWMTRLAPTVPQFDWKAAIGLALPLYLVTLASQNLPGLVVLRAAGYEPPANRLIFWGGLASTLAAPFGAHGVNLAAITAALCTNPEAHPDTAQRWKVGVIYGGLYLVVALFIPPLVQLFVAMPAHVLASVTGIALLAPLAGALGGVFKDEAYREPALLTFACTASGLALWGIGSAFWGLMVGFAALAILKRP